MALQKNQRTSPPSDLKEENDIFNGVWMQTVLHLAKNQGHKTNGSKLYVRYNTQRSKIFCKEVIRINFRWYIELYDDDGSSRPIQCQIPHLKKCVLKYLDKVGSVAL